MLSATRTLLNKEPIVQERDARIHDQWMMPETKVKHKLARMPATYYSLL